MSSIFIAFMVSLIGFAVFRYGRTQRRPLPTGIGVSLMVFPYFVHDPVLMFAIGALHLAALAVAAKFG